MRFKSAFGLMGPAFALVLAGSSSAFADVILPTADCGLAATNNCLIFNQFTVYSLALLNFQSGNTKDLNANDPYYVSSSPGQIADAIVIASSPAAARNNQDILSIAGMVDNAYNTPNNPTGPTKTVMTNFLMIPPDPLAAGFTGDNTAQSQTTVNNNTTPVEGAPGGVADGSMPLWDIQTSALQAYLGNSDLVFFFNLNQVNSEQTYLVDPLTGEKNGQDMLATLEVIFTNSQTGAQEKFYLNGNACGGGPVGSCTPAQSFAQDSTLQNDILENSTDQWAFVHGQICVDSGGAVVHFEACNVNDPSTAKTVDQNLGSEKAAFALFSQGAQDALDSGLYDTMSVDLRMAAADNGFEQLFILPGQFVTVPEPFTVSLFGAGLVGAIALRRRKRRA